MSLKDRLDYFHQQVVTKNLYSAKEPIFKRRYLRLQLIRRSAETLLCALLIFGGQQLLILNHFYLPLWPATGVALAAIFLRGNFLLVGILLGSVMSFFFNHFSGLQALLSGFLFTLHIFLIRWLVLMTIGALAPLNKSRQFLGFLIIIMVMCSLYVIFELIKHPVIPSFFFAMLGEINGILCLVPLCLAFDPFVPKRYFQPNQTWQYGSLLLLAAHVLLFYLPEIPAIVLSVILLLTMSMYAYRFGLIAISITWLMVSVLYLSSALPPYHLFQFTFSTRMVTFLFILFTLNLFISLYIGTRKQERWFSSMRVNGMDLGVLK